MHGIIRHKIRDIVRGLLGTYVIEHRLVKIRDAIHAADRTRQTEPELQRLQDLGQKLDRQLEIARQQDQRWESVAEEVMARAARLKLIVEPASAILALPKWWQRDYTEPTVAMVIRDHCRPGDVAFDVGANAGALTVLMSRLVGPRGTVCAFEASPRIVDKTQYNLVKAGCQNTTLFHRAVWRKSGALVNIAPGDHLNDHIQEGSTGVQVQTIALDDFAAALDLTPGFIKMDIEGAEYDALLGMPRLLREARPFIVLEQSEKRQLCHELLASENYCAVDLATYTRVRDENDYVDRLSNVLFVPREKTAGSPYFADAAPLCVADLRAEAFHVDTTGNVTLLRPLKLPPGRYLLRADFTADGRDNAAVAGVEADGETIIRYETFSWFLAHSYSDWPIQLDRLAEIQPFVRFLRGADPTLSWRGVKVFRLPAFDTWKPPIIA